MLYPGETSFTKRCGIRKTAPTVVAMAAADDVVRYENGEKITNFHVPTTTADYRSIHRAYLHDPDIQDARAWLPFVAMWDNHDFSWQGWQGIEKFLGPNVPAQTRKVVANLVWFEYHPGWRASRWTDFRRPHV